MFAKSVYGKGKLYSFEDLMLNGPEDFDTVLGADVRRLYDAATAGEKGTSLY